MRDRWTSNTNWWQGIKVPETPWGKCNKHKAGFLPGDRLEYTIKCRLLYSRYTRRQAKERCKELHGTTFDGMFCSGRYYVFYEVKR